MYTKYEVDKMLSNQSQELKKYMHDTFWSTDLFNRENNSKMVEISKLSETSQSSDSQIKELLTRITQINTQMNEKANNR